MFVRDVFVTFGIVLFWSVHQTQKNTVLKHICSVKLSQSNKWVNPTAASYLAPKVGELPCFLDRRRLRKMNVCGERRALTAGEMFAQLTQVLGTRVSFYVCADGRTPNPECHILFPAKHLAAAQDNRLVSAEVIMVSINSSKHAFTRIASHPALV